MFKIDNAAVRPAREKFRLSEDIILRHALLYAAAHKEGKLPTQDSGAIEGLPGQDWGNWNQALPNCGNGLTRKGVTGLPHLFNLYGLKDGRNEIPEAIAAALEILHASDNRAENFSLADTLARRAGLPILAQAVA
jgi:hypothetical protein